MMDLFLTLLFFLFCSSKSLLKILIFVPLGICRLLLELTNDKDGLLIVFCEVGVFPCLHGDVCGVWLGQAACAASGRVM